MILSNFFNKINFRHFASNVYNEQQNFYLMTPNNINNLDNAFSLNHNQSPLVSSNIPSASLRDQNLLNRHNYSESSFHGANNEAYKIILDDVNIYYLNC